MRVVEGSSKLVYVTVVDTVRCNQCHVATHVNSNELFILVTYNFG
jgi:hypothetical protein